MAVLPRYTVIKHLPVCLPSDFLLPNSHQHPTYGSHYTTCLCLRACGQVYNLLKKSLSKFILAVTVDEPTDKSPTPGEGETIVEKDNKDKAKEGDNKDAPLTAATASKDSKPSGNDSDSANGAVPDSASTAEAGAAGAALGASETGNPEETAGDVAVAGGGAKPAGKVGTLNPNGPKCVQIKMKPDWRKHGNKRRRGDLEGRGRGGKVWPDDRPDYCRFVLYKENMDTVGSVAVGYSG